LRTITENTARFCCGNYIKAKLSDILDPKPQETRTSTEIIEEMKKKVDEIRKK
jgi:hypothetical protein